MGKEYNSLDIRN